jgi:hypothetical protein
MKSIVKPRWQPLLGWAVLILAGLFATYVLYQRPVIFSGTVSAAPTTPAGPDAVAQAVKDLEAIKASPWLQGGALAGSRGGSPDIIQASPEAAVLAADAAALGAMDPSLKAYAPRERRLGDVAQPRRAAEIARFGQRPEVNQPVGLHGLASLSRPLRVRPPVHELHTGVPEAMLSGHAPWPVGPHASARIAVYP